MLRIVFAYSRLVSALLLKVLPSQCYRVDSIVTRFFYFRGVVSTRTNLQDLERKNIQAIKRSTTTSPKPLSTPNNSQRLPKFILNNTKPRLIYSPKIKNRSDAFRSHSKKDISAFLYFLRICTKNYLNIVRLLNVA